MEIFSKIALAFDHGGPFMWPIMALQVFSIVVIIERVMALYFRRTSNNSAVINEVEAHIRRGELDAVEQKLQATAATQPLAAAILAGAKAAKGLGGKDEIQGKMDEVLLVETSNIDRRTPFLAMLGNVATLSGLLGTITGMIKSFAAVANADAAQKAALLSAGISEAMNATAYGLLTAIPALVAYAILTNRTNHLLEDLNQNALRAFNLLSFAYDPMQVKTARRERTMEGHA